MTSFCPPHIIETDELWLRPFFETDAQQVFEALYGDPQVTEWLPRPTLTSVDEARALIKTWQDGWVQRTLFSWALEDKKTARICAVIELRADLPRLELGLVSSQRPQHKRRRAGLLALRKLIDWLIAQPGVYRIFACCAPQGRSAPVMEKLGFKLEGRLVNWEARPNRGLDADDALIFALTRPPPATVTSLPSQTATAIPAQAEAAVLAA